MGDNQPNLRCADADRERVVGLLREHHAEGRLDVNEFEERSTAAYAAKTYGDLSVLTADLPAAAPPAERTERDESAGVGGGRALRLLPALVLAVTAVGIWLASSLAGGSYFWLAWILGLTCLVLARRGRGSCGGSSHDGR